MKPSSETIDAANDRRMHNRRRFTRASVRWPITIINQDKTLQGRVKNISRGGILVYLTEGLEINEKVRLAIDLPEYHDAITAEGEVLRVAELKNIVDKKYSFALSIQFTDISSENLKYFSGNFAPEWHQSYEDIGTDGEEMITEGETRPYGKGTRIAFWSVLLLCLFGLFLLLKPDNDSQRGFEAQVIELKGKLDDLTSQMNEMTSTVNPNQNEAEINNEKVESLSLKLETLEKEFTEITKAFTALNKQVDTLQQLSGQNPVLAPKDIQKDTQKETATLANTAPRKIKKTDSTRQYYQVKKGENLYRISVKYNKTVEELKQLNGMSDTDKIYPGQTLRIQ